MLRLAGTGKSGFGGDGGKATDALFDELEDVAVDGAGNVFIADGFNERVRKVDARGVITTAAGSGVCGPRGDGGKATDAEFHGPWSLAVDRTGNVYIGDAWNHRVRRVGPDGLITTVVGTGKPGSDGDGGKATAARILTPTHLAMDGQGNLYIVERVLGATPARSRIRKVDTQGVITTVAGDGSDKPAPDGCRATETGFNGISGLACDKAGDLYVSESREHRVRKIHNGIVTTVAGTGTAGFQGDGGKATAARFNKPAALAFDPLGNLYISDTENYRVRKVAPDQTITTIAGNGSKGSDSEPSGDGGPAVSARLGDVTGMTVDGRGNLVLADHWVNRVRMVTAVTAPPPARPKVETLSGFGHLDKQQAKPGEPFAQPLKVEARNDGVLVAGARVRFTVTGGTGSRFETSNGRRAEANVVSDDEGVAEAPQLFAGPAGGTVAIKVTAPDKAKSHPATAAYTARVNRDR
ncbi:NHL domain-containing protein [Embleya sp. NPDC001921]